MNRRTTSSSSRMVSRSIACAAAAAGLLLGSWLGRTTVALAFAPPFGRGIMIPLRRRPAVLPPPPLHPRQVVATTLGGRTFAPPTTALQAVPVVDPSSLPALSLWTTVAQPLGSVAILAFIVLIHESGHFLAAKQFGIAVEEFSIGFGPKLWGFTRTTTVATPNDSRSSNNNNKKNDDETTTAVEEFNLRALPLGGYVRFPENYNLTLARQIDQADLVASEDFIRSRGRPTWMAQVGNALTLGFWQDKQWEDEKQRRRQQAVAALEAVQATVPWWRTKPFWKAKKAMTKAAAVATPYEIQYYDDPNLLQNRPWQERAVVLSGGVVFNLLLAFVIYFGQISLGPGLPVPTFDTGIVVKAAPRPGAPASGLLRQGDVIMQVDGVPVMSSSSSAPSAMDSQRAISNFIAKIRATPEGGSLSLTVLHPNEKQPVQINIQPTRSGFGDDKKAPMTIGTLLSPNYVETKVMKTSNPLGASELAFQYLSSITFETANGLAMFFASLFSGPGTVGGAPSSQISGPLGLIKSGTEVVATKDWTSVLLFTAAISVNLGVINSIPLPALDGGQLVFVLAEALTGKKVNQRFQERLTGVAVLFLLLLTASTFVGDVTSAIGR